MTVLINFLEEGWSLDFCVHSSVKGVMWHTQCTWIRWLLRSVALLIQFFFLFAKNSVSSVPSWSWVNILPSTEMVLFHFTSVVVQLVGFTWLLSPSLFVANVIEKSIYIIIIGNADFRLFSLLGKKNLLKLIFSSITPFSHPSEVISSWEDKYWKI